MRTFVAFALLTTLSAMANAQGYIFSSSGGTENFLHVRLSDESVATFSTGTSEFTPGTYNQGWYSSVDLSEYGGDDNDNTYAGEVDGAALRNFFSFDLSGLALGGRSVVSASLEAYTFDIAGEGTYRMYDVSTDAEYLNFNNNYLHPAVFADLGTGNSYGEYVLNAEDANTTLSFSLNPAALSDITASAGGWFSIGGMVDPEPQAVPEPASMAALGLGAVALIRRRRKA